MDIDLTQYTDDFNTALADGTPCVVATVGDDGIPDIGYKGSVMVYDKDHLAYWERTHGQAQANVAHNPGVAVLYRNPAKGLMLRVFGRATLYESGPIRDAIMARTIEAELNRDPERKGAGVLIQVERVAAPPARRP